MTDNKGINTLPSVKDFNRKETKKDKKEDRNILGSSLEKKISSVNKEIDRMKTDEILLNVDPEVDAIEAIEQIQNYYNLIKKEISKINKRVSEEKSLIKEIIQQEIRIEELFKPKKINYDFKNPFGTQTNINNTSLSQSDRRKPVIDYKTKIKNLNHEIHLTSQNYNDTKAKNELLRRELDEMRKSVLIRKEKVDHLYKELLVLETEYKEEKRKIEGELDQRKIDMRREVDKKTSELAEKNMDMIEKIRRNDDKITKILARKKHIEHEKIKLMEKKASIENYWLKKNEEFFRGKYEQIAKLNNNDDADKVLEALSGEKINQYREIVSKLYQQDSDEDDVMKITRLLEYFINSTKEFKNHEDFIFALQTKVNELEKEVEELENIINFFENNLNINEEEKLLNEDDLDKLEVVKINIENLLSMQYIILVEKYKSYCEEIKTVFNELIPNPLDSELDFSEFSKKMFGKFQDLLKGCLLRLNTNNTSKSTNVKHMSTKEFHNVRVEQLNVIENEFKDKSERIKDAAKTFYEKSGAKLSIENIRGLVMPVILNNDGGEKDKDKLKKRFKY